VYRQSTTQQPADPHARHPERSEGSHPERSHPDQNDDEGCRWSPRHPKLRLSSELCDQSFRSAVALPPLLTLPHDHPNDRARSAALNQNNSATRSWPSSRGAQRRRISLRLPRIPRIPRSVFPPRPPSPRR